MISHLPRNAVAVMCVGTWILAAPTLQAATVSSPSQLTKQLAAIADAHDDVALQQWVDDLLAHQRFDELGDIFEYFEYFESAPQLQQAVAAWCAREPSSPSAWLTGGAFYRGFAWVARGAGWASTVKAENRRLFRQRLEQAQAALERAIQLHPDDPNAHALLIGVALGLGHDKAYVMEQFRLATRAAPTHYLAHLLTMLYLTPKWHGSIQETLQFAEMASHQAPVGSRVRLIPARAYHNIFSGNEGEKFLRRPEVWQETETAFSEYLESNPNDLRMRNYFARYAYEDGHSEIAREQLAIIGQDWDQPCWGSRTYFDTASRELSVH